MTLDLGETVQLGDGAARRCVHVDPDHAAARSVDANYRVTQFSGDDGRLIGLAFDSVSLSGLGLPPGQWPQIGMLLTNSDQDGCLGAQLNLHYAGTARGD